MASSIFASEIKWVAEELRIQALILSYSRMISPLVSFIMHLKRSFKVFHFQTETTCCLITLKHLARNMSSTKFIHGRWNGKGRLLKSGIFVDGSDRINKNYFVIVVLFRMFGFFEDEFRPCCIVRSLRHCLQMLL